jgi:16S rRNA (cytidine1402-2'-O)-methyltransferase
MSGNLDPEQLADSKDINQLAGLTPGLYVVATPLGNLADISRRAIDVLSQASLVAAEDTRHSAKLLQHYQIDAELVSCHEFTSESKIQSLVSRLQSGESIALISDAGTPLISDPGYVLVAACHRLGIAVHPVPGACAAIAALSVAGLPSHSFRFEGFLPAKPGNRKKALQALADESATLIFYEAPHRVLACVEDMAEVFGGDRQMAVCRELTKRWETIRCATTNSIVEWMRSDSNQQRGEFVLLVEGVTAIKADDGISDEVQHMLSVLLESMSVSQAAATAAKISGLKKNHLYKLALEMQASDT